MKLTPQEETLVKGLVVNTEAFELLCNRMKDDISNDFMNMSPDTLTARQAEWKAVDAFRSKVIQLSMNLNEEP